MSAPAVSIILPTYNERESLPRLIPEIRAALAGIPHEIVVVDDDSPDGTWQWVTDEMPKDAALRLVRRRTNRGLSAAVLDGFEAAKADRWIVMDADGQHDPAILPALYHGLVLHDIAAASRYIAGGGTGNWNVLRWLASRGATVLAQLVLNVSLSDPMSGYFGIRRSAYAKIAGTANPRGFKILLELYARLVRSAGPAGLRCLEVPFTFRTRLAGESKVTGRIAWQYLQQLAALRREGPWPQGLPKFICVGIMGMVVNCAVLSFLVYRMHWHFLLASAAAIQVGIGHNFIWHDRWTFKDRREHSHWLMRFRNYEISSLASMLMNWGLLAVLVGWARQPLLATNITGVAAGAVVNFAIAKLWTWKRRPAIIENQA